jgi:phosphoribosylanthranilate isomerase
MLLYARRITNLTDARYFAAREVTFLGFNLEEGTEGYLEPMYMKAMREWVEGPSIIGEFSKAPMAWVREAASFYALDGLAVSASNHLHELTGTEGLPIFLDLDIPFHAGTWDDIFQKHAHLFSKVIIPVGTDPEVIHYLNSPGFHDLAFLQFDLPVREIPPLVDTLRPAGLCVTGGEEEKTGVKSFDDLEILLEELGFS